MHDLLSSGRPKCATSVEASIPTLTCSPSSITLLTGNEPKLLDDFHCSETTKIFLQEQSSDAVPSCLLDAELSDETIGRALSSPMFVQEREEPADRRQAYHSFEESLLPARSLSVCHARMERPVHERSSLSSRSREKLVSCFGLVRARET